MLNMYTVGSLIFLIGLAVGIKLTLLVQVTTFVILVLLFLPFHKKFEGLAIGIPMVLFIIFAVGIIIGDFAYLLQN